MKNEDSILCVFRKKPISLISLFIISTTIFYGQEIDMQQETNIKEWWIEPCRLQQIKLYDNIEDYKNFVVSFEHKIIEDSIVSFKNAILLFNEEGLFYVINCKNAKYNKLKKYLSIPLCSMKKYYKDCYYSTTAGGDPQPLKIYENKSVNYDFINNTVKMMDIIISNNSEE